MLSPIRTVSSWIDNKSIDDPLFKMISWMPALGNCVEAWKIRLLFNKGKHYLEEAREAQGPQAKVYALQRAAKLLEDVATFSRKVSLDKVALKTTIVAVVVFSTCLCNLPIGFGVATAVIASSLFKCKLLEQTSKELNGLLAEASILLSETLPFATSSL